MLCGYKDISAASPRLATADRAAEELSRELVHSAPQLTEDVRRAARDRTEEVIRFRRTGSKDLNSVKSTVSQVNETKLSPNPKRPCVSCVVNDR